MAQEDYVDGELKLFHYQNKVQKIPKSNEND